VSVFLSPERLSDAVGRLQGSAARSRLVDYLILRRALVLGAARGSSRDGILGGQVILSMRDEAFMQAMYELAAVARAPDVDTSAPARLYDLDVVAQDLDLQWSGLPYFQVFGTAGEIEHGYRTRKYRSNGTADTVTKGPFIAKALVELVPNTRPRAIKLGRGNTPDVLTAVFIGTGDRPRIDDFACWWFRATDLEPLGSALDSRDLVQATVEDFALSNEEVEALFTPAPQPIPAATIGQVPQP
jgi:hypothetical protein